MDRSRLQPLLLRLFSIHEETCRPEGKALGKLHRLESLQVRVDPLNQRVRVASHVPSFRL